MLTTQFKSRVNKSQRGSVKRIESRTQEQSLPQHPPPEKRPIQKFRGKVVPLHQLGPSRRFNGFISCSENCTSFETYPRSSWLSQSKIRGRVENAIKPRQCISRFTRSRRRGSASLVSPVAEGEAVVLSFHPQPKARQCISRFTGSRRRGSASLVSPVAEGEAVVLSFHP